MMDSQLLASPVFQSYLVVLIAVVMERLWPIQKRFHPLTFFSLLATRMIHKVHLSKNTSNYQQTLSGSLAMLILVIPIVLFVIAVIQFAEYPIFFEGFLLLISIYFQPDFKSAKNAMSGLKQEKKTLVRHQLESICLRETRSLSPLGMAKATIESLILRFCYQVIIPIFWFMWLGGSGALLYRLLYELNQSWNRKRYINQHFGQPIAKLFNFIKWFPAQLCLMLMMLAENLGLGLRAYVGQFGRSTRQQITAMCGAVLKIELGGPVIYDNKKYRFERFVGRKPVADDIMRGLSLCQKMLAIWLVLLCLICAVIFAFTKGKIQ